MLRLGGSVCEPLSFPVMMIGDGDGGGLVVGWWWWSVVGPVGGGVMPPRAPRTMLPRALRTMGISVCPKSGHGRYS